MVSEKKEKIHEEGAGGWERKKTKYRMAFYTDDKRIQYIPATGA